MKNSCVMYFVKEIMFFFKIKFISVLGVKVNEQYKLIKDRLKRKKYIGV